MKKPKNRRCEICGARVRNMNPRVATCGPICTEAKHKGRTHKHQMRLEANKPAPYSPFNDAPEYHESFA